MFELHELCSRQATTESQSTQRTRREVQNSSGEVIKTKSLFPKLKATRLVSASQAKKFSLCVASASSVALWLSQRTTLQALKSAMA
ncbi:MAG: hypothetical protein ACI8WB_003741 [Phenylobacterium sp.]|jgi:hypothetical protein